MRNLSTTSKLVTLVACSTSVPSSPSHLVVTSAVAESTNPPIQHFHPTSYSTLSSSSTNTVPPTQGPITVTTKKGTSADKFCSSLCNPSRESVVGKIPRGGDDRRYNHNDGNDSDGNDNDDTCSTTETVNDDPTKPSSSSKMKNKKRKKKKSKNEESKVKVSSSETDDGIETNTQPIKNDDEDHDNLPNDNAATPGTPLEAQKESKIRPDVKAVVDEVLQHENDYYQILGISETATDRQIQKAYRKRVQKCHPDKTNGDRRAFDLVAKAYKTLSDESKRQLYDRFGKDGLESGNGGVGVSSYQDMFRQMFHQAQQQRRQPPRNPTLRYQLQVTLEELYHGCTQRATVTPPYNPYQMHSTSRSSNRKTLDVHIPKGSISGQSIIMSGEADFNQDTTPGDVIFILTQATHPIFTRKGHDLAMELTIGLDEAISGVHRPIPHLDGTKIWIESANISHHKKSPFGFGHRHHHDRHDDGKGLDDNTTKGSPSQTVSTESDPFVVIQTGDVQVLKGRGMPKRNQPGEFGDLYIQFRVQMPAGESGERLTDEEQAELSRLLEKLQGKSTQKHNHDARRSRRGRHKDRHENGTSNNQDDQIELHHKLQTAEAADFGRASGKIVLDDDDTSTSGGFHDEHGDEYHTFASGARGFFQSGGTGGSSRFYFGSNGGSPFGMGGSEEDDDGNVQCQQM